MEKDSISSAWKQVILFAATVGAPLAFAFYAVLHLPPKHPGSTDDTTALIILGLVVAFFAFALTLMAKRRSVDISAERISIKHSFYTCTLEKKALTSLTIRELKSVDELGLSWRKNGIAIFGYYSGWFVGTYNQKLFCAIAAHPMYDIAIEGDGVKCKRIGISCSPETAERIRAWGASHGVA